MTTVESEYPRNNLNVSEAKDETLIYNNGFMEVIEVASMKVYTDTEPKLMINNDKSHLRIL